MAQQRLNTPFHRLTEEEIRQWYSDKFITTACYLLAIRRITKPPGAKFVISNVLEFCEKWGITKSAFYRAVNDLKRKGYTEWETTHGITFTDSNKILTFPISEKCSTSEIEERRVESHARDSESHERHCESYERDCKSEEGDTQALKSLPNLDCEHPQIIQTTQTNQIGAVDEKVEQRSSPIQDEVRSPEGQCARARSLDQNDTSLSVEVQLTTFSNEVQPSKSDPTTAAAQRLTNAWSSVLVKPNNLGQGKTDTPRRENDFQIPQELRAKLEELQIPLDDRVKKAMSNDKPLRVYASHDISQAYGAVAHVERTWETIDNPRGVFLFQIGRQPIEPMGSRLPVRTAAELGFTLEHLKKIYPNNWQDAARHLGLEVAV